MDDWLKKQADAETKIRLARPVRYFVVYKTVVGGIAETRGERIGLFANAGDAERMARAIFERAGTEVISVKPESRFQAVSHAVFRFIIRSIRVLIGAVIAIVAWALLYGNNTGVGDSPFSQLTISMLFGALLKFVLAMGIAWICWAIAFGPAPEERR